MSYGTEKGGKAVDLVGSFGSRTATSGTAQNTAVMPLGNNTRRVMIEVYYDGNATPGGGVELVPLLCMDDLPPALGDDRWTIPGVWDGTVTVGAGIAPASGNDWTTTPGFGRVVHNPLALRTLATTGASDKVRVHFSINVEGHNWLALQYAEFSANAGNVWIRARAYS